MGKAILTVGLGYGDEGKGTTVDWLARACGASLVVRYNGGAQAAHNVVDGDRHHTFAQLGSATFLGVPTLLSRFMLVNPIALLAEANQLGEAATGLGHPLEPASRGHESRSLERVFVEEDALVTTPFHVSANRLRETIRSGGRHGSCGMGIGETTADSLEVGDEALRVRDLFDPIVTRRKLASLRDRKLASFEAPPATVDLDVLTDPKTIDRCLEAYAAFVDGVRVVGPAYLAGMLRGHGNVIFEGAQGVLLDQDFGFQPHTTWTDITLANALTLLAGHTGDIERLGIVRAYLTRHGRGPFVSEDARFTPLSAHDHNGWGPWQGGFRSGAFDEVATRYALEVLGGVDALVMTNLDRLDLWDGPVPIVTAYENATDPTFFASSTRIRVRRPFDLAHQEALTHALDRVRPVVTHLPVRGARYAAAIGERLGLPLRMMSFGPSAADKRTCAAPRFAHSRRVDRGDTPSQA